MMDKKKRFRFRMKKNSLLKKIIIVGILLVVILNIFRYAAYFKKEDNSRLFVIIQNEVKVELAHDVYIDDNDVVYLSEEDMKEYFDRDLYYEKDDSNLRRYISISDNKVLEITEDKNHMYVNGVFTKIKGKVLDKDGVFYFPISELTEIYNVEVDYLKEKNRLNIDKLSEEKTTGVVNRNTDLKYKMTNISKNIEKLEQGEVVTIVEDMDSKWVRVKTDDYAVGYVKKSKLIDISKKRSTLGLSSEDFSNFDFENDIVIEIDNDTYENFDERISNYDNRTELIKELNDKLMIEIENASNSSKNLGIKMNISDVTNVENYYKFLRELKAYVNSNGCFLIIVNKPEFERRTIEKVANIVL